ncbi:MAG: hypothetical protein AUK24_01500 [Syntrophaceae bacterium CG2_30_49_12]|nr:MAG: hypothetical protein AUK24_01500 [Syntrophaceae bacterium CG2_30_49_12]
MPDALQQGGGGFVVWVLGDEFAAEGIGEDGLGEFVNVCFCLLVTRLDLVSDFEEGFDTTGDPKLLANIYPISNNSNCSGSHKGTKTQRIHISLSTLSDNKQDIPTTQQILCPHKKGY